MRLVSAHIHGFRRFVTNEKLYVDRRLVCLVGPNEVGKSSALLALERGRDAEEIVATDRSRSVAVPDDQVVVQLDFRLGDEDRRAIADLGLPGQAEQALFFRVTKLANGQRGTRLGPQRLNRDLKPRKAAARALRRAAEGSEWLSEEQTAGTPAEPPRLTAIHEELSKKDDDLDGSAVEEIRGLANALDGAEVHDGLARQLDALVEHESAVNPHREARRRLLERTPEFVPFDDEARVLEAEYDLATVAADAPLALTNLAALAGLDLAELHTAVDSGLTGRAQTLSDAANEQLRREFEAWNQKPPIQVKFAYTDTVLRIHVRSGSGELMKINERSEGLRQFVALVALIGGAHRAIKPVLMIDEAERHLHLDAQADLMQILAEQTAAEQIIYTTHSPGCLPENIGSSVRVLAGVGEATESTIRNQFWTEEAGLGPMLLAMGAASLAFVPLRSAAIVEGGSDLVLLGDLTLEAIDAEFLGYQIVPGSSNLRPAQIAGLDLQGRETVWIYDGDGHGEEQKKLLTEQHNIPAERVLLQKDANGNPLDLEDLIHSETYVRAVNGYLKDVEAEETLGEDDLPAETCKRHKTVEAWCNARGVNPPSKPAIANKVLDLREDQEEQAPLLDEQYREVVADLHQRALAGLGIEPGS